jgi:hypothetical protein
LPHARTLARHARPCRSDRSHLRNPALPIPTCGAARTAARTKCRRPLSAQSCARPSRKSTRTSTRTAQAHVTHLTHCCSTRSRCCASCMRAYAPTAGCTHAHAHLHELTRRWHVAGGQE